MRDEHAGGPVALRREGRGTRRRAEIGPGVR
jgi:hypothetical protein